METDKTCHKYNMNSKKRMNREEKKTYKKINIDKSIQKSRQR